MKNLFLGLKAKKSISYKKKNVTMLFYNNFGTPKLIIRDYKKGLLVNTFDVDLTNFNFENGLVSNVLSLSEKIKELIPNISSIEVILNIKESFKCIESIPKMPLVKARALYEKELANDFPKYKDNYEVYKSYYTHSLGLVFSTFFVPLNVINYFKKLAKSLNVKLSSINLWGNYLFDNVKKRVKEDYVLIYIHDDFGTILNSYNGSLLTFSSFDCNSEKDIVTNFLTKISRYEFELSKSSISNYIYIGNEQYSSLDFLANINKIDFELDFDHYNGYGK